MHSLDNLQVTVNSCRYRLWLRLVKQDRRKLMSEHSSRSSTFLRCCAVAKLEDTLDQSSVVGYKCKAIQWLLLSQQVETPAYGQALWVVQYHSNVRHTVSTHNLHPSVCTSHTYLTMFGVPDWHLLQLHTWANTLQHWYRVHVPNLDLPQTLHVWEGCSYNITSTLRKGDKLK